MLFRSISFTSCTNEIAGTDIQEETGEKFTVNVTFPETPDTRLGFEDVVNVGFKVKWEEGDRLIAFNKLGIRAGIFNLVDGAGTSKATFEAHCAMKTGLYTFVYAPEHGVIKSTLAEMRNYLETLLLTQVGNGTTNHIKYGHGLEFETNYDGSGKIDDSLIDYTSCTYTFNIEPVAGAENKNIMTVIFYNGEERHELNVKNAPWNETVRVHMVGRVHKAEARTLKCYVITDDCDLVDGFYSQTIDVTEYENIAGRRYVNTLSNLK